MRTHLHKDSLARQQQEQQQLKSLGLIGGTSLSTTSPNNINISNNNNICSSAATATSTITCPNNLNALSSAAAAALAATAVAADQGAQEASTALAASAAAQLNQQLVAAFKQHLLTVVQSKQTSLDYGEVDDDDEDGLGPGDEIDRIQRENQDCQDNVDELHDSYSEQELGQHDDHNQEIQQVEDEDKDEDRMDTSDRSTIGTVTGNIELNRINAASSSSIASDDEEDNTMEEDEQGVADDTDANADVADADDADADTDDDDATDDEEDRMDINDGSIIEINETRDLKNRLCSTIASSIASEDDTSYLGSDNNNSSQMPLTPFASSLATTTVTTPTIKSDKNINNNNSSKYNNNNNDRLNAEPEQMLNLNQHNQLKQHLQPQQQQQKQSDLQTSHHLQPNDNSLNSNGSHEIIEDISQSYVKTANPNAARKGGKRNRHCYKCKLCTYSSVDRCTLVRHLRIHSGERPYICGICRYAFTTKANCERHVRKRHKKQYNSLGGAGGGGVKGSNGGGRSLIITDHSNHQTIPVKVNPVAAQTISQTLQRIQEKQLQQQQSDNHIASSATNSTATTTTTTTADGDLALGRISNNHHQPISNNHLDSRIDINNNSNNNNNHHHKATSLTSGFNKSKRKHRLDKTNIMDHSAVPYQRRRLFDKHDEVFSTSRLSTGRKQAQHHLDAIQRQHPNNSNLLFNPQSSSFAPNLTASTGPEIPPSNELFVNLVTQLQQVITNSHQQQQQIEQSNNSIINNNSNIDTPPNLRLPPLASPVSATNVSSATFLANMLAAGKLIGNAAIVGSNDVQQSPGQSTRSSLSPKHLSLQLATQLRNLNSQTPFFIGRNPFDPFNPLDLAAQALDLSCKFQSDENLNSRL